MLGKFDAGYGLTRRRSTTDWVREFRHKALKVFRDKPMPTHWATKDLENIDFDEIRYYLSDGQKPKRSWDEVPDDVLETFERLGIPSRSASSSPASRPSSTPRPPTPTSRKLTKQGVIFVNSTEGLKEHEEIFRPWFGKVIPTGDNKFSALNSAVFSGGSFIYVPPGVKVKHPLQAYFRINSENFGQFERTLIIADEGSEVMYMEGCTAPKFETATLHSRWSNWSPSRARRSSTSPCRTGASNVFNLVTKRGLAHGGCRGPLDRLQHRLAPDHEIPRRHHERPRARGEVISIALANTGQHQDTGAKMIHAADETTSNIVSKSISVGKGRATYRGQVHIPKHLKGCKNNTECDALLINTNSRTDTYPAITVRGNRTPPSTRPASPRSAPRRSSTCSSAASMKARPCRLAVNGFINDLVREFPMEYSVELKRLIDLEMEGSVFVEEAHLGSDKFLALHQALSHCGGVIHVPKGVVVEDPILIYHWTTQDGVAVFPHTLVIAEESASVNVIDVFQSVANDLKAVCVASGNIYAAPNAQVLRKCVQNWSDATISFQSDATRLMQDATTKTLAVNLGSKRARFENQVRLSGPGSNAILYSLTVAQGEQEFDQRTYQSHEAPHAVSDLLYKNALLDNSRTIFSGMIKVEKDAQQTDAYQTNRNLLLSPTADANALPGLEIQANDVKCSHGATTGQLNPEELFYMMQRGIPKRTAQQLMAFGFFEEVIDKFENEEIRDNVRTLVQSKFHL
jgi:Fe-S cluster assembly protein SufB